MSLKALSIFIVCLIFQYWAYTETTLSIKPEKIDFGTFPAKDKQEGTAKISNNGNVPVKIVSIRNTCSCAEVKIDKMVISPQGTAELKVTLLPEGIYGEFSKNIYIETDSKTERFMTVTISGNSQALIRVIPESNVNLGILKKNTKLQQELELQSANANIELGQPVIKGEISISTTLTVQRPGSFILKYELESGNQNRKLDAEITVPIIKPEGWKPVLISITGRIGSQLIVIPSKITLPVNASESIEKTFQIRLSGTKIFSSKLITSTEIKGINVKFENEKENTVSVRISFTSEFIRNLKPKKTVQIKIQYPDAESTNLLVNIE